MNEKVSQASISRSACLDIPRPGGDLRLFVALPEAPPPPEGWPVLWVLDGNRTFPLALWSARAQALRPRATGVVPALVVAIGYADEGRLRALRLRDLTPPAPPDRLRPRPSGEPWTETGRAPELLDLIRARLMPMVAARYHVNPARQVLFGHSLGGLFALYTAFRAPELFHGVIASSPSIWFGERIVLDHAEGYAGRLAGVGRSRDLVLSVGALEQKVAQERAATLGPRYADWAEGNRMIENVAELAARLAPVPGLDLHHFLLPDENHATAPAAALTRGLRIVLRPDAPGLAPLTPADPLTTRPDC